MGYTDYGLHPEWFTGFWLPKFKNLLVLIYNPLQCRKGVTHKRFLLYTITLPRKTTKPRAARSKSKHQSKQVLILGLSAFFGTYIHTTLAVGRRPFIQADPGKAGLSCCCFLIDATPPFLFLAGS